MLVLSRKLNESIIIGDRIKITVVGLRGNQVRLGIEAPGDVTIMRQELLDADERSGASDTPVAARRDGLQALAAR
jgi:carbon storage regulator